jgi:hypothetical protein
MDKQEAISAIADGHAIYKEDYCRQIFEALDVPWKYEYSQPWYNEPNTFKGAEISPENEGFHGCSALQLGDLVLSHYHLTAPSKFGRGSQGRENAQALREYFNANVS